MGISFSLPKLRKNTLNLSTGDFAKQANGSVVATFSDTVVLATACISSQPKENAGFLPLFVEFCDYTCF